jgi:hypothetical protein
MLRHPPERPLNQRVRSSIPWRRTIKPQVDTTVDLRFCCFGRPPATARTVHFVLIASPSRLLGGTRDGMKIDIQTRSLARCHAEQPRVRVLPRIRTCAALCTEVLAL